MSYETVILGAIETYEKNYDTSSKKVKTDIKNLKAKLERCQKIMQDNDNITEHQTQNHFLLQEINKLINEWSLKGWWAFLSGSSSPKLKTDIENLLNDDSFFSNKPLKNIGGLLQVISEFEKSCWEVSDKRKEDIQELKNILSNQESEPNKRIALFDYLSKMRTGWKWFKTGNSRLKKLIINANNKYCDPLAQTNSVRKEISHDVEVLYANVYGYISKGMTIGDHFTSDIIKKVAFVCDEDGSTLLHCCASWGGLKSLQSLLEIPNVANVMINIADKRGDTPLHIAVRQAVISSDLPRLGIIRLLIERGGAVDFANKKCKTPYSLAKEKTDVIKVVNNVGKSRLSVMPVGRVDQSALSLDRTITLNVKNEDVKEICKKVRDFITQEEEYIALIGRNNHMVDSLEHEKTTPVKMYLQETLAEIFKIKNLFADLKKDFDLRPNKKFRIFTGSEEEFEQLNASERTIVFKQLLELLVKFSNIFISGSFYRNFGIIKDFMAIREDIQKQLKTKIKLIPLEFRSEDEKLKQEKTKLNALIECDLLRKMERDYEPFIDEFKEIMVRYFGSRIMKNISESIDLIYIFLEVKLVNDPDHNDLLQELEEEGENQFSKAQQTKCLIAILQQLHQTNAIEYLHDKVKVIFIGNDAWNQFENALLDAIPQGPNVRGKIVELPAFDLENPQLCYVAHFTHDEWNIITSVLPPQQLLLQQAIAETSNIIQEDEPITALPLSRKQLNSKAFSWKNQSAQMFSPKSKANVRKDGGLAKLTRRRNYSELETCLNEKFKLQIFPVVGGGNCQFTAIAKQLLQLYPQGFPSELKQLFLEAELESIAKKLRELAVNYLRQNRKDFEQLDFTEDFYDNWSGTRDFDGYLLYLQQDRKYSSEHALKALAQVLNHPIFVLHPDMINNNATRLENRIYRPGADNNDWEEFNIRTALIITYNGFDHYETISDRPTPELTQFVENKLSMNFNPIPQEQTEVDINGKLEEFQRQESFLSGDELNSTSEQIMSKLAEELEYSDSSENESEAEAEEYDSVASNSM